MKKRVLVDVKMVADVSRGISSWRILTPEQEVKEMKSLASEFNDFVRDHRSMDWVTLEVEETYQEQCSHCEREWEVDENGVPVCCDEAENEYQNSLQAAADGLIQTAIE